MVMGAMVTKSYCIFSDTRLLPLSALTKLNKSNFVRGYGLHFKMVLG